MKAEEMMLAPVGPAEPVTVTLDAGDVRKLCYILALQLYGVEFAAVAGARDVEQDAAELLDVFRPVFPTGTYTREEVDHGHAA